MPEENGLEVIKRSLAQAGLSVPLANSVDWVGSVIPAAIWAVDPQSEHGSKRAAEAMGVQAAKQAVVIMVDGLGVSPLRSRMSYARNLRKLSGSMTTGQSTLPSTTAAALTAFTTGALPGSTRMVGYAVRRKNLVMNLLNFEPDVVVEEWQSVPTLFERISSSSFRTRIITRPKFYGSGLTRASFRGAEFVGREGLGERFDAALTGVREGIELQVVYWSEIDHTGHKHGVGSLEWAHQLEEFDTALGAFLARVPRQTLVLMTADHGMVDVEQIIDVADEPELRTDVPLIAGEGRAVHIHTTPGCKRRVLDRWAKRLEGIADVVPSDQLPALMGPGVGLDQVGAGVAFLRDRTVILDSRSQKESVFKMVGVHGSYTEEEMLIPLWRLA